MSRSSSRGTDGCWTQPSEIRAAFRSVCDCDRRENRDSEAKGPLHTGCLALLGQGTVPRTEEPRKWKRDHPQNTRVTLEGCTGLVGRETGATDRPRSTYGIQWSPNHTHREARDRFGCHTRPRHRPRSSRPMAFLGASEVRVGCDQVRLDTVVDSARAWAERPRGEVEALPVPAFALRQT